MKFVFATILLITSLAFSATTEQVITPEPTPAPEAPKKVTAAPFGAFTKGNYLYVTHLGDCNKMGAKLEVDSLCHKDRVTRNLALRCGVEMNVVSTQMICPEMIFPPQVMVFDLANEPIAPEARQLIIKSGEHSVRVKINRE